jgi:hypothetical protein
MQIEMTLNVTVRGTDLVEIQKGLTEAALRSFTTAAPVAATTSGFLQTNAAQAAGAPVPAIVIPPQGEHLGKIDPEREQIALEAEKKEVGTKAQAHKGPARRRGSGRERASSEPRH